MAAMIWPSSSCLGQHAVEDRLDERGNAGRRGAIHDHGGEPRRPAARGMAGRTDQPQEGVHSLNRYFSEHPQRDDAVAPADFLALVVAAAVVGDRNLVHAIAALEDLRRHLRLDAEAVRTRSVIDRSTSVRITL